jgi:hypothetical protein
MAHYAIIQDNKITQVFVGVDEDVVQNGVGGSTEAWEAFYTEQLKNPTLIVKRTSYNASGKKGDYRGTYAGIGFTYDAVNDVFVAPPVEEPVEP